MPLPIQNSRISTLIHAAYNTVGRYRARIDETVVPVCVVDDFTAGSSFPVVRRAASQARETAVANERATFRFESPPNILCVVRQLYILPSTQDFISINFGSTVAAPANISAPVYIEGRIRTKGESPGGRLASDTQVAALSPFQLRFLVTTAGGNQPFLANVEWPIGQATNNDFLEIQFNPVNVTCQMSIIWDEYLITP